MLRSRSSYYLSCVPVVVINAFFGRCFWTALAAAAVVVAAACLSREGHLGCCWACTVQLLYCMSSVLKCNLTTVTTIPISLNVDSSLLQTPHSLLSLSLCCAFKARVEQLNFDRVPHCDLEKFKYKCFLPISITGTFTIFNFQMCKLLYDKAITC